MSYSLHITSKALREIDEALEWRANRSAASAILWYMKLMEAVRALADNPEQWGLAPESEWCPDVRQYIFGKKRRAYRILFEIRSDAVYILRVRHGAQKMLGPNDL